MTQSATNLDDVALDIDPHRSTEFRTALGQFSSGVVVITGITADGAPVGMTCQSFISVSLDPPLVAFSPSRVSATFPLLRAVVRICINVLAADQGWISNQFAKSGSDKWADVLWVPGKNGAPRIQGSTMWCEGEIGQIHGAGDHYIATVEVQALAIADSNCSPLIFHRGNYVQINA